MSNVYVVAWEKKSKDEWEFYDDLSQPIDLLTEHVIGWPRAGAKERQRILALLEEQTRLMKGLDVDAREAWTIRPDSKSITFWERAREWLTVWPALTAYTVQWSIWLGPR
ncbi:hypothetical protein OOZ51_14400 [Arthrobacter sp. MI7-26]|uniref:hypothetical protein n=1 Tax=Arthrobacter sp. MI7-26 TaxID=2993653 RepID=UPI0022494920|nr:hypothetical protein [Arthrobacter sp. MI7-26]MCX2748996.1 hypothetical protein [Arthrobacter sp. MI7-26]